MIEVILLYLCFTALMFLGSLILSTHPYPFFIAGARFFVSGVILLAMYAARHQHRIRQDIKQIWCMPFLYYALCLYTVSALGFSWAMQYVDPVKGCFIFVLAPFITALLLYVLRNQTLSRQKMIGLLIGFIAIVPIILECQHEQLCQNSWQLTVLGYLVFTAAVVTLAYGWILNKAMYQVVHAPSAFVTGSALVVGGGTTLTTFLLLERERVFMMQTSPDFWWLLLLFSILTAFCYNLYAQLLKRFSVTFLSFAGFLEPAFGLLYAAVFLGQPVSQVSLVALAGLGLGLYLFYQEELRLI